MLIENEVKLGVVGIISVQVLRDGVVSREVQPFCNMILDSGLAYLAGTATSFNSQMVAGSGNSTPTASQTQLDSKLGNNTPAASGGDTGGINIVDRYVWGKRVYTSAVGAVVGNVSEIGFGPNAAGTGLFSRALIKDAGGTPITISVQADEQLRVTYEIRINQPIGQQFDVTLGSTQVVCRPFMINDNELWSVNNIGSNYNSAGLPFARSANYYGCTVYTGEIVSDTVLPTGTKLDITTIANIEYLSVGIMQNTSTLNTTLGNIAGGIGVMHVRYGAVHFQYQFTPKIAKTSNNKLTFVTKLTYNRT